MASIPLTDTQLEQAKQLVHGLAVHENTLLIALVSTRSLYKAIDSVEPGDATSPEAQARLGLIKALDGASHGHFDLARLFWDQDDVKSLSDAARKYSTLFTYRDDYGQAVEAFQTRLFAEEPTATIYGLISDGHLTVTPDRVKTGGLQILDKGISDGFNISKDPIDNLVHKANLGDDDTSKAIRSFFENLSRLQALVRLPTDLDALLKSPFTSAQQIAHTPRSSFISIMNQYGLPADRAVFIHEHATLVDMRNEQIWTALLEFRNPVRIAALTPLGGGDGGEQALSAQTSSSSQAVAGTAPSATTVAAASAAPPAVPTKQVTSYSEVFASDMAFSACDDCNSITSPAAYFVDLLRMLKNTPSNASTTNSLSLLDKLVVRRPDMLTLQLSCVNTNVLIPYIDLANEAMESFIKNVGSLVPPAAVPIQGYNMTDQDTSEISLSGPQHTDYSVYSNQIAGQTFPLTVFPYSQALDLQRLFFVNLKTSLSDVIGTFGSEPRLYQTAKGDSNPPAPTADQLKLAGEVLETAAAAENLNISPADYTIITGTSIFSLEFLKSIVDTSMDQAGYETKIGVLPVSKYWGYDSTSEMLSEVDNKGLPFVKAQLIRRADVTVAELLDILKARLLQAQLVLENPDGSAEFSGKMEDLRLRHPTDSNPKNPITEADCRLLLSIIRLWRKTGWSLQDLDCALISFGTGDGTHGYTANATTIKAMAAIQRLSSFTGVDIYRLMPLWGLMDTSGDKSLYARLFLKGKAGRNDPIFGPDDKGLYLQTGVSLNSNRAPLLAAFKISEESFSAIVSAAKITDDKLNLANVSAVYRISVLCQLLSIEPVYFEGFRVIADPGSEVFVKPQVALDIITKYQHLAQDAGLSLEQLLFFTGNDQALVAKNRDLGLTTQQVVMAESDIMVGIQASKDGLPAIDDRTMTAFASDVVAVSNKLFDAVTAQQVATFIEMTTSAQLTDTSSVYTNVLLPYFSNATEAHKIYFEQPEPITGTDEEKAIAHENNLNSRRVYFLKATINPLQAYLASDVVLKVLTTLFPDAIPAVLGQLLSTVNTYDSKAILDALTGLAASNGDALKKDSSDVFFRPLVADTYRIVISAASQASTPQVTLDGMALIFEKGNAGWASNQVQLSNGQAYNLHRIDTGGLAGAFFSTQQSPTPSPFPLGTLLARDTIVSGQGSLRTLSRSTQLSTTFKLSLDELRFFQAQSSGSALDVDFGNVDFKAIQMLQTYEELSAKMKLPTDLLVFLKWTTNQSRTGTLSGKLAALLSVVEAQINSYLTQRFSGRNEQQIIQAFQGTTELKQLLDSLSFATRTGVPGLTLELLFSVATPVVPPTVTADFDNASKLRRLLESVPISGDASLAAQVNGGLRTNQRAALVAYLLQHPYITARGITDADGLFEFLLIDVQMGPCLQTSRIKQAISTVQLYVRRCILGLEKPEQVASNTVNMDRWKWMEGYRLWEANRKVFLYPENWLDASLRDDKTEVFQALESAILQNDIDADKIAELLKAYVYGVDDIADLDVQAYLWKSGVEDYTGRFHFFGRTRTAPYIYHYRTLDISVSPSGRSIKIYWQPWTKIDVEVPVYEVDSEGKLLPESGTYLIPALYGDRVFLFFPQITLKTTPNPAPNDKPIKDLGDQKPSSVKPIKHWQVQMGWTERRNGRWTPKQVSQATLEVAGAQESGFPGKGSPPGSAWAEALNLPSISSLKFWIWSRPSAIVPPAAGTRTVVAAPSIAKRVPPPSTSTLVIDVERWVDAGSGQSPRYVNYPLGRFEMRGSAGQVVLANMSLVSSTDTFKTPWQATIPTVFHKLSYHKETSADKDTPGLIIVRGSSRKEPQLGIVSDLVDNTVKKDIEWTISFNDAQKQKATGLVQDIVTTESTISYVTYPPFTTSSFPSDVFQHTLDRDLISMATTYDGVDQVYAFLASVPKEEWFLAFGKRNGLVNELSTPYAIYNWELGAHAVMLLMERLQSTQQYDLALQVAHFVFDPTIDGDNITRCWLFPPFKELADPNTPIKSIQDILKALLPSTGAEEEMNSNVLQWRQNPFNPHSVARGRPQAYMRRIIMKYIEILIAAGDVYFRQNTLETVPLAIQRYVEASHVFGSAPIQVPQLTKPVYKSYADLDKGFNDFSNTALDMELDFPFYSDPATRGSNSGNGQASPAGILKSTYFCVPANPKLMDLRNLINDRLFKIRNCQDINGIVRSLALFEAPLDPGMLIRAAASGVDVSKLLSSTTALLPNHRFQFLLQKAFDVCAQVQAMGASLLSIKEKKDTEALACLQARQNRVIQSLTIGLKNIALKQAESSIDALLETRKAQVARLEYYLALIGEDKVAPEEAQEWEDIAIAIEKPTTDDLRMTSYESLEMKKTAVAAALNSGATAIDIAASVLKMIPDIQEEAEPLGVGVTIGSVTSNISDSMEIMANVMRFQGQISADEGARAARAGALVQQLQERQFEANAAGRDIKETDRQIATSRIQVEMCERDIQIQEQQADYAKETEEWLRKKYTSEQLYAWMDGVAKNLYYQTYLLANDLAQKAQTAFRFESGDRSINIVGPSSWDGGQDGLFAGESLYQSLKRLEVTYMEKRMHDFEVVKDVSLRQIRPWALITLRETGTAEFDLPEVLFDFDFPGHYCRRLKSVGMSVLCDIGPSVGVNATLTLLQHRYRVKADAKNASSYPQQGLDDDRFQTDQVPITSIAVSGNKEDQGVFNLDFANDRYIPFEGAGAVSRWRLELPTAVKQFDYGSISDVIVHLNYTTLQGGAGFRKAASDAALAFQKNAADLSATEGMFALLDLPSDFPKEWATFVGADKSKAATIPLAALRDRLPFFTRGKTVKAETISVLLLAGSVVDMEKDITLTATRSVALTAGTSVGSYQVATAGKAAADVSVGDWSLTLQPKALSASVTKILVVFRYTM